MANKVRITSSKNPDGKILANTMVTSILLTVLSCNPKSAEMQKNHKKYKTQLDKIFKGVLSDNKPEDVHIFIVPDEDQLEEDHEDFIPEDERTSAVYGTSITGLYNVLSLVPLYTVERFRAGKGGKQASELEEISI